MSERRLFILFYRRSSTPLYTHSRQCFLQVSRSSSSAADILLRTHLIGLRQQTRPRWTHPGEHPPGNNAVLCRLIVYAFFAFPPSLRATLFERSADL